MTAFISLGGVVYFEALYFEACLNKSELNAIIRVIAIKPAEEPQ